jgi:hypothetical protein
MKYATIYKMMLLMGSMFLSISLFAQESKSKQDVINIINNIPMSQNVYAGFIRDYLRPKFSPSDVPAMYDYILDKTMDISMRAELSRIAASFNPEKQQIDRAVNFAIQHMPEYKDRDRRQFNAGVILPTIRILYKNTKDDKILETFRKYYEDSSCGTPCKYAMVQTMDDIQALQNITFFNKVFHDSNSNSDLKQFSARVLAKQNWLQYMPYLRERANYLFATDKPKEQDAEYIEAVNMIGTLGQMHYEANAAIQEIITKACNLDTDKYGPMMKSPENVARLFSALEQNGGEGNRKYLESLLDKGCSYPNSEQYTKKALKNMPDKLPIQPPILPFS